MLVFWTAVLFVGSSSSIFAQSNLKPTIQISANVYTYRLDGEKQLGIFYQYNRDKGSVQNSDVFLPGTENLGEQAVGALDVSGSFASFNYGSIDYNLKTAVEEGRATLINHQRAMVADGETFSFIVGEKVPITVIEVKGSNISLKTEDRDTGIKLNGTPRIFRSTNVLMDLEIEASEITSLSEFDRGDGQRYTLPAITKRNVKTCVIVPSERPVYIGGLYSNVTGDMTRKVPIIGDLPVIGFFLRGFNKKRNQDETIFRITPVIKAPGEGLDIGSSVFEELLQPEGDLSLIQEQGLKSTGAAHGGIPGSATDVLSATDVISATDVLSATGDLDIPSPLIKSATSGEGEAPIIEPQQSDKSSSKNRFGSSSKTWLNR
ncbi:MAG: type II secretion system protein GspD [Candidatus Hinthialibacter sp.]